MKKVVVILVAVLAAITIASSARAETSSPQKQIRKGATGLTWLSNPAHAHFGTRRSRARAYIRSRRLFFLGLRRAGWYDAAMCVHGKEGSWDDTRNPVDDGGMQMDIGFQTTYGLVYYRRWGRAYNWPDWAQLHAAFRGWSARGWWPWPNTAHACGLI